MAINTPTITVTNNDDGTATVSVAGSTSGSTNTLYYLRVTDEDEAWTTGSNRTSDGTISATVNNGHYWWRVQSSLAGDTTTSNLIYRAITDGTDPLYDRILEAVAVRIRSLSLDGITAVYTRSFIDEKNVSYPCVICSVDGVSESDVSVVNARDDLQYPIRVQVVDRTSADRMNDSANRRRYLRWRQSIARAFRAQRLAGADAGSESVWNCTVQYGQVVDPNQGSYDYAVANLVLLFTSREPRGIGA